MASENIEANVGGWTELANNEAFTAQVVGQFTVRIWSAANDPGVGFMGGFRRHRDEEFRNSQTSKKWWVRIDDERANASSICVVVKEPD
jgi:hypothetical protein